MDDILIKSMDRVRLFTNLQETFNTLRKYDLKLNPDKCVFGVKVGKFLWFMITERGIEDNPEKIKAI